MIEFKWSHHSLGKRVDFSLKDYVCVNIEIEEVTYKSNIVVRYSFSEGVDKFNPFGSRIIICLSGKHKELPTVKENINIKLMKIFREHFPELLI